MARLEDVLQSNIDHTQMDIMNHEFLIQINLTCLSLIKLQTRHEISGKDSRMLTETAERLGQIYQETRKRILENAVEEYNREFIKDHPLEEIQEKTDG